MKRQLWLIAILTLVFGTSAYATNDGAGCGLGSQLFKGQSGVVPHVLAATTNGTSGNATFGMTSGTLGCKQDNVIAKAKEAEVFIAVNLGALNQEMAQGQGEHVVALASLMGCPTTMHGQFAQMSQESYGKVFASSDASATAVLSGLKEELNRRPALAASCGRVS